MSGPYLNLTHIQSPALAFTSFPQPGWTTGMGSCLSKSNPAANPPSSSREEKPVSTQSAVPSNVRKNLHRLSWSAREDPKNDADSLRAIPVDHDEGPVPTIPQKTNAARSSLQTPDSEVGGLRKWPTQRNTSPEGSSSYAIQLRHDVPDTPLPAFTSDSGLKGILPPITPPAWAKGATRSNDTASGPLLAKTVDQRRPPPAPAPGIRNPAPATWRARENPKVGLSHASRASTYNTDELSVAKHTKDFPVTSSPIVPTPTSNVNVIRQRVSLLVSKSLQNGVHPFIVHITDFVEVDGRPSLFSLSIQAQELGVYIEGHPDADRISLALDITEGLMYLHECDVVHSDLQPLNVVVNNGGRAMIRGFGIAAIVGEIAIKLYSTRYSAPELLDGTKHNFKTDVFSLSGIFLFLMTGIPPYASIKHDPEIVLAQSRGILPMRDDYPGLDDQLWHLIVRGWAKDPAERPSTKVICDDMFLMNIKARPATQRPRGQSHSPAADPISIRPIVSQSDAAASPLRRAPDPPLCDVPLPADSLVALDLTDKVEKLYDQATKKGGFADIYEGIIISTGQKVAIKSLRGAHMGEMDPESRDGQERLDKRLKREMRVWLPLRSSRIVPCLGFAYVGGMPCLINPWYASGNAKDYITADPGCDRRPLVIQIAEGLAYLHNRTPAVVHYDVKSTNVLIDDDGCARLTDYGIAKILEDLRSGFTTTNDQLYAARCSSPEALAGGERTVQSDVYSFACFALEMMTGKAPFYKLKFTAAVIGRKCGGAIPGRDDFPELDATDPLWPLLEACWNMGPDQRPTMVEVLTNLKGLGFVA